MTTDWVNARSTIVRQSGQEHPIVYRCNHASLRTCSIPRETIGIHSVGNLTLSWDHRAFDGAYAAAFTARIKEIIETRDWEAEL